MKTHLRALPASFPGPWQVGMPISWFSIQFFSGKSYGFQAISHPAPWFGSRPGCCQVYMGWCCWKIGPHDTCEGGPNVNEVLHPQSLTWNLKMMVSKRNLLFQGLIFRFHVKLQGCSLENDVLTNTYLFIYIALHIISLPNCLGAQTGNYAREDQGFFFIGCQICRDSFKGKEKTT